MVGGAEVAVLAVKPLVDKPSWLGPIAFVALVAVGIAGWLLFRPSCGDPPQGEKGTI